MLSFSLLVQALPLTSPSMKVGQEAGGARFDQYLSEKTPTNSIDHAAQSNTNEDEVESEDGSSLLSEIPVEPATPSDTNSGVEPDLAQNEIEAAGITVPSASNPELATSNPDVGNLNTVDQEGKGRKATPSENNASLPLENTTTEPVVIRDMEVESAQTRTMVDAENTAVQPLEALDSNHLVSTDGKALLETDIAAPQEEEQSVDLSGRKSGEDTVIQEISLKNPAAPDTANLTSSTTPDQQGLAGITAINGETPAEPVLDQGFAPVKESAGVQVELVNNSTGTKQKAMAGIPSQSAGSQIPQTPNDILPRQRSEPATATVAPNTTSSRLVEVNVQPPAAAPAAPQNFETPLSKAVAEAQKNNIPSDTKLPETRKLGDGSVSGFAQQWRPTLTAVSPTPEAQSPPAQQPSRSPIVRQVIEQLVQFPTENGVATIRLKPHGMGVIEITIDRTKEGNLNVDMRVQNPLVLEAMRNERAAISHLFQPTGNNTGGALSMDLFQSGTGRNDQNQQGQATKDPRPSDHENPQENPENAPVELQRNQTRTSDVLNILT